MKAPITAKQAWTALAAIYGWPDKGQKIDDKAEASELQLSYGMALSMIETLQDERDEYQQCADTQAAAHKVERDALVEQLKRHDLAYVDYLRVLSERGALRAAAQLALHSMALNKYAVSMELNQYDVADTSIHVDVMQYNAAIEALTEALK